MKKEWLIVAVLFFSLFLVLSITIFGNQPIENEEETVKQAEKLSREWNGESVRRSILLYESLYDHSLKTKNIEKITEYLRQASKLYIQLGDVNTAIKTLEKAEGFDKKHKIISGIIENASLKSRVYVDLGDLQLSEKYLSQALKLLPYSNEKGNQISVSFASGYYYFGKHANQKALEDFSKAIKIAEETKSIQQIAELNYELSYVYVINGDYVNAEKSANESLKNWTKLNDFRGIALTEIVLGGIEWVKGNNQVALQHLSHAERLFPKDLAHYDKANLLNRFADIYEDYSYFELSLNYRKQALKSFQITKHISGQISTLIRLANLSLRIGDLQTSQELLAEAKDLTTTINDIFFIAIIDSETANYFYILNDYKNAEIYYKQALKVLLLQKQVYKYDIVRIQLKLSEVSVKKRNLAEAFRYLEQTMNQGRKVKDKIVLSQTVFQLAKLHQLENKLEEALINIKESINLTESLYSEVANSNLQRSYFSSVYDRYELYIHLLMQKYKETQNQDFLIQALQASEKSRSRSLLETLRLSEANFTKDANPELVAKEKELRNLWSIKVGKLTNLLNAEADKTEIEKVEMEIRTLENDLEGIKAELKQNSPVYSALKNPAPFDVAEFQKNVLDEKTILLEFALGERESYLWIVSKNEVSHVVLPTRDVIENRIDRIHKNFESRESLPNEEIEVYQQRISDLEKEFDSESKLLSNELLGQINDKIKDKRLIVIPDGKLVLLPISALPLPNSDNPLILNHEIVYEPSASLLNILANLQTSKQTPTKDLLIFADPVYNQLDNRLIAKKPEASNYSKMLGLNLRDFRLLDEKGNIPRLFATQNEADSIIKIVGQSRAVLATGFSVNRDRVLNSDISDYRILHFATHGLVDVNRPEISSIVLSQFDENGDKAEGFLRLQDIYSLNLTSDLVVLSSCRSGIGKEIKGEGLMSLNNAFLQAGARSVLSSAWKVDDTATAELMKYFYANLTEKNLTPANALREAQLKMLNSGQFKSPFYWAAFTIQGEFRQPLSIKNLYFYYYLIPIFIILGLIAVWRFRKVKI